MLIIRFARFGRKKQAFFHLVVAEKSNAVKKKSVARLGTYNPHAESGKGMFDFDKAAVEKHIANGAGVSQSAARLLVKHGVEVATKFIKKRPTKPKKEVPAPENTEAVA
jgi:small subunit ribosomal protein S16